jgi:ribose/xylose/arabinose/galactoside ABC-type transport system permease subunit
MTTPKILDYFKGRSMMMRELGILIVLIALIVFFSLTSKVFFTTNNLLNITRQVSLLGIMAMGMTMVIAVGGVDLSVGAVYAVCATSAAALMTRGQIPIIYAVLLALLIGAAIGALNGFLVGYLRILPFIVTMGTMNIARGLALIVAGGKIISLDKDPVADPENLKLFFKLGGGYVGVIPSLVVILISVVLISYLFFHKSLTGFRLRAVGGSIDASLASGINIKRTLMVPYIITSLLCAVAAIANFSFMHTAQGTMAQGQELQVLAAAYIGGASPNGGSGTILGTMIGVLILGVLQNGLVLLGVNVFVQQVMIGILVIGAVVIDIYRGSKRK